MLTVGLGSQEQYKEYTRLPQKKLFKRILIANRGEIALRIIRACRELHIESVAVYTPHDRNTLGVKYADRAYQVGRNTDDYLNIRKVIAIAKKAKVDAIHPGYGFLAENSDFAALCEKNRIKFIGPSSESMSVMGSKDHARAMAERLNIPVLRGTRPLKDEHDALREAKKIGFPIIIKAIAGGGGKGMRVIRSPHDLHAAFRSASAEAKASFGKGALYIEKYLEDPSHVEFQILADRFGHAIHLGERDCSIQRKHQKLIEESPSPALPDGLRQQMGDAAVALAKSAHYEGAGTIEFLIDRRKNFYFIEMNTRIQVEHGITEMVTGVDLIKEQIKIAAGGKLAYRQQDIKFDGWAIECRINAESPAQNFAPQTGTISNYLPPGGIGIRVCSSCHTGHVVSPHYDSLIAKLMCKGSSRLEAIARMRRALAEYIIEGVETTIPLHLAVLANREFMKGNVTTHFIEKFGILEKLKKTAPKRKPMKKSQKTIIITAAVAKYLDGRQPASGAGGQGWVQAAREEALQHGEVQNPSF
ncbi:acetyl-CoA carboxylase biotin carboxylase subunit [Candidatus Woesearchaeota archaeon]|nr:acetyl-CoA carboxylase biotin carboxylase subunit [Candidatus Woesearchaeota archaeon]